MMYRARRRPTFFHVFLKTDRGRFRASIVDVTEKGARLRLGTGSLVPDSDVTLEIQGRFHPARVVWSNADHAGIAFEHLLPLDVLGAINSNLHRATPAK